MVPADPQQILAQNLDRLISGLNPRPPRPQLAARMGIGDKTLGFLKAGTGNPTLDNIAKVARFFRVEPWTLLKPDEPVVASKLEELASLATPRSRASLESIQRAADRGELSEADLQLLAIIAERFMGK